MINSRCFAAGRAAYSCLQALTDNLMLNEISKDNHEPFNKAIGFLTFDAFSGTPQHKKAILGHMLNYPIHARTVYDLSKYKNKITTFEPLGPSAHIITEAPVCDALIKRFDIDIINVTVTSDTMPVTVEGQKQSNLDFITTITSKLDHCLGLGHSNKNLVRMQDCKDGGGILKHSTRGSMGIITFDKEGKNIQTTPTPITEETLRLYNQDRLNSLSMYLNQNKLYNHFKHSLDQCQFEFDKLKHGKSIFDVNIAIEDILWNNIQKDPLFPRSVSFVFLQKVNFETHPSNFQKRLMDSLNPQKNQDKPYNLDKKGDAKEFYIALLNAYYKEEDPEIFNKLLHVKHSGISFSNFFNEILTSCIKNL